MSRKSFTWSPAKEALLIKCYADTPNSIIARELDASVVFIKKKAKSLGLKKGSNVVRHVDKYAAIKAIGLSKYSYTELANRLGCHRNTVARYAKKLKSEGKLADCPMEQVSVKMSRIRHDVVKRERARVIYGLEQRTEIKVFASKRKMAVRKKLRHYGYRIQRGGNVAVITPDTNQHERLEKSARKFGISFDLDWDAFHSFLWEGSAEAQIADEEKDS